MEKRKDSKKRVLKEGEYERANGSFEYKWRDKQGKRHSIYAKTLEALRDKEADILRDVLDGIRADKRDITVSTLKQARLTAYIRFYIRCLSWGLRMNIFAAIRRIMR